MKNYTVLILSFLPVLFIPILFLMLKSIKPFIEKAVELNERRNNKYDRRSIPNKKAFKFLKIFFESFIGLVIFYSCLRILSLPLYLLGNISGNLVLLFTIAVMLFSVIFAGIITFKAIRYVHRHLELF
jgi:hypothetical protein